MTSVFVVFAVVTATYAAAFRPALADTAAFYWVFGEHFIFLRETWQISGLTCELTGLRESGAR